MMQHKIRRGLALACLIAAVTGAWLSRGPTTLANDNTSTSASARVLDSQTTGDAAKATASTATPQTNDIARAAAGRRAQHTRASGAVVAVVKVEKMIYGFTYESLKRRIERATQSGATLIVVELDTPGGMVDAGMDISKFLKSSDVSVPTVAWVNRSAYSAGTLIAAACDEIIMAPGSALGDSAPISLMGNLSATERAKAVSPLLAEYRDSARQKHYDFALFHAMCELGVELYMIRHRDTDDVRLVNQSDYRFLVQGHGDSADPADAADMPVLNESGSGPVVPPMVSELATAEHRGRWELVRQVHDGRTLLTLNASEAYGIGMALRDDIRTIADLQSYLQAASVTYVNPSWSEVIAGWLTHPIVRAVLLVIFAVGFFIEMQSPGLGIPGGVALIALVMLMGAPFVVGLAEIWHIVVFVIGLLLLLLEVFVLPGFGVPGIVGIVLMLTGLVLSAVPTSGTGPLKMPASGATMILQQSVMWTLLGLVGSIAALFAIARYFGSVPGMNRLVLQTPASFPVRVSSDDPRTTRVIQPPAVHVSGDESLGGGEINVGDVGTTITELRPTGRAAIGKTVADVVSNGLWIEAGKSIRVTEIHGNRIVVEPVEESL